MKNGVEARVREQCPTLLDIDGDVCHHLHNASKRFTAAFDGHLEQFFTDLYNEMRFHSYLPRYLEEVEDQYNFLN